jgi:hypothetical protein
VLEGKLKKLCRSVRGRCASHSSVEGESK